MANPERTNFFCATSQDGEPFGLRFDPARFSDKALKIMLWYKIKSVFHAGDTATITTSNGHINIEEVKIRPGQLAGSNKEQRKAMLSDLFGRIRNEKVRQVVIRVEAKKDPNVLGNL